MATVTPIPPALDATGEPGSGRARPVAGLVGAALGLAGMALLYLGVTAAGLGAHPAFALAVGPDGIFSPTRGAPFVWLVPPLAAGVAGVVLAPRAAARRPLAGVTMGYLTYALGIAVGPVFVLFLPSLGSATAGMGAVGALDAAIGLLIGIGVLWLAGAVVLAPLLAVCVLAGVAWAGAVRAVVRRPIPVAEAQGSPRLAAVLVVVAGVLAFLWVLLTTFLQILVDSQAT